MTPWMALTSSKRHLQSRKPKENEMHGIQPRKITVNIDIIITTDATTLQTELAIATVEDIIAHVEKTSMEKMATDTNDLATQKTMTAKIGTAARNAIDEIIATSGRPATIQARKFG